MIEIIITPDFEDSVKFYRNKKHYKNIEDDIAPVVEQIKAGDFVGDEIPNLSLSNGEHTYKVRIACKDINAGKSNGYRMIYYAVNEANVVYLLDIYLKKDNSRVLTNREIIDKINQYCE